MTSLCASNFWPSTGALGRSHPTKSCPLLFHLLYQSTNPASQYSLFISTLLNAVCRAEEMDGGPRQPSAGLRHHTIVHGWTDQLASSARSRKRQRLRGREHPTRHLRESLACLRIIRRLLATAVESRRVLSNFDCIGLRRLPLVSRIGYSNLIRGIQNCSNRNPVREQKRIPGQNSVRKL